jgi:hypothetical protein
MSETKMGLRQRILQATTVGAIETLLKEGLTFTFASEKTRRSWKNAAKRRTAELEKGVPTNA